MGIFESFSEKQAIKLIMHHTGQTVSPNFFATCDATISPKWRGAVLMDDHSLWLVNRFGARGVEISNIAPMKGNGQYSFGTSGYPKYHFNFAFVNGQGSFGVYPLTEDGGRKMLQYIRRFERESEVNPVEQLVHIRICDSCGKIVAQSFDVCPSCNGSAFTHKKVSARELSEYSNAEPYVEPSHKICPMCAEEVKFAARKCRFCHHMFEK